MASTELTGAGGTFAYIRNNGGTIEYSYNNSTWSTVTFPCGVENTNTSAGYFQVVFTTDITLSSTNDYFYPLSEKIQFGSTSLKSDGTRPVITISVGSYPGLIENGTSATSAYNDIRVYNLTVDGTGYSTSLGGGWIGRTYYGNGASGCYIINCVAKGTIGNNAGGILGNYSGTSGGSISILGCSSTGTIGQQAGGIIGANCDNVTCTQCYSEGSIAQNGGGITGQNTGGGCSAEKCYSLGSIALGAGGIIGAVAASGVSASKCYSTGAIGTSAGGIFGSQAGTATAGDVVTATNCYSTGTVGGSEAGGIFGKPFSTNGTRTETNCYKVEGGSWSDATANTNLTGIPSSSPGVGSTWVSTALNTAYELADFGYTPYATLVIASNALVQSASQTIVAGNTSAAGLVSGANSYTILTKSGGDSDSHGSITIDSTTGALSTTTSVVAGTYTVKIRRDGSYFITTYVLTITEYIAPVVATTTTCCASTIDERGLDYQQIVDYRIGNRLLLEVSQNSKITFDGYSQYVKYKMAQGSRKV